MHQFWSWSNAALKASALPMLVIALLVSGLPFGIAQAQAPHSHPITVGAPIRPLVVNMNPNDLMAAPPSVEVAEGRDESILSQRPPLRQRPVVGVQLRADTAQDAIGLISDLDVDIAGIQSLSNPPDTVGDMGPNHYVQMVNATQFQIWDKQGNSSLGPANFGNLWPVGARCRSNRGDPIVVYDHLADRWLLSQFALPNQMCIAISQTPDPTAGTWFLYEFDTGDFLPDYPKFGVWPDGYYMSSYEHPISGNGPVDLGVYVFDRASMLNGAAAGFRKSTLPALGAPSVRDTRALPADLDGTPPPEGTPGYFIRSVDEQQDTSNPTDRIEVYQFDVDWASNAASFTLVDTLTPVAFDIMLCDRNGQGTRDCIPQPAVDDTIDAISNRAMMQLKYRYFGTYAAMVFNQTIDVSGSIPNVLPFTPPHEVAGIRWYELRRTGANWAIHQQGTYAPQPINAANENDLLHRWMGSMAMDRAGNIAMGYSIVNSNSTNGQEVFPGIRYTGRGAGDPLGVMPQGEKIATNGTVSQGNNNGSVEPQRWGDYSALSVDPRDDCTFWFTTHVAGGATRIGSFRFPTCSGTDLGVAASVTPALATAGAEMTYAITVENRGSNIATNVVVSNTLAPALVYLTSSVPCTELPTGTVACTFSEIPPGQSRILTVQVRVNPSLIVDTGGPTSVTDAVTVFSDAQDPALANNTAVIATLVNDAADLRVAKDCKPDRPAAVPAGVEAICTITIENLGPSDARNVKAVDTHVSDGVFNFGIPAPATCVPAGVNPQQQSGVVNCSFDRLAAGISAVVQVPVSAFEPQDINDQVTVSSVTPDPNPANNQAADMLTVAAVTDLIVTKADAPDPVIPDTKLTYTLVVTNHGPSTAHDVILADNLPSAVTVISATVAAGTGVCLPPQGDPARIDCLLGTMSTGMTATVTIVVIPHAETVITNVANVLGREDDPDPVNNTAVEHTVVGFYHGYLPTIMFDSYGSIPDLVPVALTVTPNTGLNKQTEVKLSISLQNLGKGATKDEFWIDLYINPTNPPEKPGDIWNIVCKRRPDDRCLDDLGLAWLVTKSVAPSEMITLTSDISDPYLEPTQTRWYETFKVRGTQHIWAFVDAWGEPNHAWGAVAEFNERNNRFGPIYVEVAGETSETEFTGHALGAQIPPRRAPKPLRIMGSE